MGVREDLIPSMDEICGVRDDIGAIKDTVWIVTRTWSGSVPGDGTMSEIAVQMLPSPRIVNLKHRYAQKEGGSTREGVLLLKMISQESFPNRTDVDCSTGGAKNVQKYYRIDGFLYEVVDVEKRIVTWNVEIKRKGPA